MREESSPRDSPASRWSNLIRQVPTKRPRGLSRQPHDYVLALSGQGAASLPLYAELKRALSLAGNEWTRNFLQLDGLSTLLDSLTTPPTTPTGRPVNSVAEAFLQSERVHCVRAVMDSRISLDYIVENKEYTQKLAAALDTNNGTVKKQVFELLSALCVYNSEAYNRAIETLQCHKELKEQRYRFKVVVDELRHSKNIEYQTSLLAFINCLIIKSPCVQQRIRIRNEFIGLRLLDIIALLRLQDVADTDLIVQLDVFDEHRYADDGQLTLPDGVDLNSHLDLFYAILNQVSGSPQEQVFLNILQHLLRIDSSQPISDVIWETADTLVHRATLLESKEDSEKLLRTNLKSRLTEIKCQCSCHKDEVDNGRVRRRTLVNLPFLEGLRTPGILSPTSSANPFSPIFSHPTEPLLSVAAAPPPPPPPLPPLLGFPSSPVTTLPLRNPDSGIPPPPPLPLPGPGLQPPPTPPIAPNSPVLPRASDPRLPQQETPKPKSKMKSLNWNKIPIHKVMDSNNNVWSRLAKTHDGRKNDMDFEAMEELFRQGTNTPIGGQASPRLSYRDIKSTTDSLDRKKREINEVNLLDGKRSLNVNIFLKQFRSTNDEIIRLIRTGQHEKIGAEKLRGLLKLLPETDEIELLKGYDGDQTRLGNAEKFLLQLVHLSDYKLRIEGMLLKEEFTTNMAFLEPALESITSAAQEIQECRELHEVMYLALVAGNFLNSGGYAGNAAGFKMMSLLKLADIRANKPGMNLIHYVALQAEQRSKQLPKFPEVLQNLDDAAKLSIDNLKQETSSLGEKVTKLSGMVENAEPEIQDQMLDFIKLAKEEVAEFEKDLNDLENIRQKMADFLCEDVKSFKLEECFRIFQSFRSKFKVAVEDNERRRQQEKKSEARRRQREENLILKRRGSDLRSRHSGNETDSNIMDMLLGDIRSGFTRLKDNSFKVRKVKKTTLESGPELSRMNSQNSSVPSEEEMATNSPRILRRRMGSITTDGGDNCESPELTPNGSLRRRRNRLSSEDDNLIDYLRQAAEQEGRDRRPPAAAVADGGSLDRSWLRRSSGRSRRRPELLAPSDFASERERPSSPVASEKSQQEVTTDNDTDSKPKQWRRKIEDWFNENEKEQQEPEKRSPRLYETRKRPESEVLDTYSNLETLHEADVQKSEPVTVVKDKSKWRKSTLNVASTTEPVEDERRHSRSRRRSSNEEMTSPSQEVRPFITTVPSLQVIEPKEIPIVPKTECREDIVPVKSSDEIVSALPQFTCLQKEQLEKKGETDRSVRRSLRYKKFLESKNQTGSGEEDEDGNFDRFAPIRKTTRRSRMRPRTSESGGDGAIDSSKEQSLTLSDAVTSGTEDKGLCKGTTAKSSTTDSEALLHSSSVEHGTVGDTSKKKEKPSLRSRLAKRLHSLTENLKSGNKVADAPPTSSIHKMETSDVLQELNHAQEQGIKTNSLPNKDSPIVHTPEIGNIQELHPSYPRTEKNLYKSPSEQIYNQMNGKMLMSSPSFKRKSDEHDEGFEESQSLLSESPSHGCNYEMDSLEPTPNVGTQSLQAESTSFMPDKVKNLTPTGSIIPGRIPRISPMRSSSTIPERFAQPVRRSPSRASAKASTENKNEDDQQPARNNQKVNVRNTPESRENLSPQRTPSLSAIRPPQKTKSMASPRPEQKPTNVTRNSSLKSIPVPQNNSLVAKSKIPKGPSPTRSNNIANRNGDKTFSFMRATSASSAKVLPSKPADQIQKVRVQVVDMTPSTIIKK